MKRLIVFFFLISFGVSGFSQVVSGEFDLRRINLSEPVELNGYWEFYWKQLINPGSFTGEKQYYYFPSLWNEGIIGEDTLDPIGYGTYRLKLLLGKESTDYALFLDDFYSSCKLFLDGNLIYEAGKVASSRDSYTPKWETAVVPLGELSGEVELVLQIANYHHSKGGALDPIKFGMRNELESGINLYQNMDIALTVFFILVAIFFLIRFGFFTLDIASFYFSLFCLFYSYRIIGADLYVLHSLIPNYPWEVAIRVEYITLFVSPFLFAKYLQAIYPKESSTTAINVLGILGAAFIVVTLATPATFFTKLVEPFFVILGGYFFYGFTIFTSALLEKRTGSVFGFIGVVIVFANFGYLMLAYVSWMPQNPLFSYAGYFLFLLFQTLSLVLISNKNYTDYGLEVEE